MTNILNDFSSVGASMFFTVFSVIYGIVFFIALAFFIFNGFGIFKISKNAEIKAPWLAFVPILSVFAMGRIAEKYVKRDGKGSAKMGALLLCFSILTAVLLVALIVFLVIAIIQIASVADNAVNEELALGIADFKAFIPVIIFYVLAIASSVTYSVLYYISLWRIFAMLDNSNATLFLVLSIFFSFVMPFFIFFMRNNKLKTTYAERMGFEPVEMAV